MAKSKKKDTKSFLVKPQSATVTGKKQSKNVERAGKVIATVASLAIPGGAGAKIGATAGKALARAVGKEAGPKVLKAANKARGAGKQVNPKPAMGKVERTAPKRDVLVKSADKTLATNGFINRRGVQSVKTGQTNKPAVRTIEKEVSREKANKATAGANKMRYGGAKAEKKRMQEAVGQSKILKRGGAATGASAGLGAGAAGAKALNKKKDTKKNKK